MANKREDRRTWEMPMQVHVKYTRLIIPQKSQENSSFCERFGTADFCTGCLFEWALMVAKARWWLNFFMES